VALFACFSPHFHRNFGLPTHQKAGMWNDGLSAGLECGMERVLGNDCQAPYAQSRLTLETEATYVSCTSPSGPGSICPSEASSSSTSHTRTARPESVDFGSWRRGAVAFSSEACRPTQPQWHLSAVPIGLGRRVRRLSSRLMGVYSFSDVSRRCDCRNEAKCSAGGTPHLRSGAAHTTARGIWGFANSLRRAR